MGISINSIATGLKRKASKIGSGAPLAPQARTPARLDAPGGFIVGLQATATLPDWVGADSTENYWTLDGVDYVTVSGNNPLTLPNEVGQVLGLRCSATNTVGTRTQYATGFAIEAGQTEVEEPPTKNSSASISAPNGYAAGELVTATPSSWSNAVSVIDYWKVGSNNTYAPVSGNNPFSVPDLEGETLGIYSIASNDAGQVTDTVSGGTIAAGVQYLTQTLFSAVPSVTPVNEGQASNLSLRFTSDISGQITQIWFSKPPQSTATSRACRLINTAGTVLGTGTSSSEPAAGRIAINLTSPVTIAANTEYEAVVNMPDGWNYVQLDQFNSAVTNGHLTALAGGTRGNGRYSYSTPISNPDTSWRNSNYGVDVTFRYVDTPPAATAPVLLTPSSISAPDGVVVGEQVTATLATFSDADEVLAHWELDQNIYLPVAGNNPLTVPNEVGKRLGLWVRGVNEVGTTSSLITGEQIQAAAPEPEYTTEYGESITVKSGATRGSEGVANMLATQFRFLKEGWVDGFQFVKHASDPTTSRAYRVWDYPSMGSTSGTTLVSGTTSSEATGTEHVEEVLFSSPLVYDTIGDIVEIGYQAPNPGWVIAKTEEYNSDKTHGNVVTRGYGAGSNGPNGNGRYQATTSIVQPNQSWYNSDYFIRPIFRSISGDIPDPPDPPPLGEWPGPTNTGVPAGVTLTNSGGFSTSSNGQVIENLRITGPVTINHSNVTIRNCEFRTAGIEYAVNMPSINYGGAGVPGLYIHDCTFIGQGATRYAIKARGRFDRLNISGVENGISLTGISNSGFRNGAEVTNCWIHDLAYTGGNPHFDCIEMDGGSCWLEHNYLNMVGMTQTSTIMLDNYNYGVSAAMVKNNLLRGGGYTVFMDGRFGGGSFPNNVVTFDGNEFGEWTPGNGRLAVGGTMTFIQMNNIDYFTRQPVDLTLPWWQY